MASLPTYWSTWRPTTTATNSSSCRRQWRHWTLSTIIYSIDVGHAAGRFWRHTSTMLTGLGLGTSEGGGRRRRCCSRVNVHGSCPSSVLSSSCSVVLVLILLQLNDVV